MKYIDDNSICFWYSNDKIHREYGPSIECANGDCEWYLNGKLHRENGPAIEYADGTRMWYLNGKRHREDGPAIEYDNGARWWYLNGKELTEAEFNKKMGKGVSTKQPTMTVDFDGDRWWWLNGLLHREDGPAIEYASGTCSWYINGKRHREDGPAIEYADGTRMWYLNGEELTEAEFKQRTKTNTQEPVAWRWVYDGGPDSDRCFSLPAPGVDVINKAAQAEYPRTVQYLFSEPVKTVIPSEIKEAISYLVSMAAITDQDCALHYAKIIDGWVKSEEKS